MRLGRQDVPFCSTDLEKRQAKTGIAKPVQPSNELKTQWDYPLRMNDVGEGPQHHDLYRSDISSRSQALKRLAGGSVTTSTWGMPYCTLRTCRQPTGLAGVVGP